MKQPLLLSSLLSLAAVVVQADDVVAPWNKLIRDGVVKNKISTSDTSRIMAMVHVAQYQAVNDVLQSRHKTAEDMENDPALKAKAIAAVAGAGETVLNLITVESSGFTSSINWGERSDNEVDRQQAVMTRGASGYTPLFQRQVGNDPRLLEASARAANFGTALVTHRANDGFNATLPEFKGFTQNGMWRPTPHEYKSAEDQQWGKVKPWVLASVEHQRLAAPPALDSPTYRQSFDEIVKLGRADSRSVRTDDQSQIANFWKKSPEVSWFSVLDQVTANFSVVDASRAYALASVAFADSRISAMDNKYFFSHWRPISAVTTGTADLPADPSYASFLTTPATPEYPSGHGSLAGTLAEVYTGLNGGRDEFDFSVTSPVTSPGGSTTRNYNSFSQAAEETSLSRLYAGDHFRHTCVTSGDLGKQVAQTVIRDFDAKYSHAANAAAFSARKGKRGTRNNALRG